MNKFLYIIIIIIFSFLIYGIFIEVNKTNDKKEKRISCQKKTVTFENITNKENINQAISLFNTNNFTILSRIELSKYMDSKILNFITKEKADKILIDIINKYKKKDIQSEGNLIIDYYIYENDKEDKGKKSKKAKLYAGYLLFEFKLDNKLIYKIQTDYMKIDTSDIPERMECVIKSFISIKG